jgi:predicted acetyltransferase
LRVRLEAGTNGARCTPTDAQPDLTIDIAALGAIYLGGTRLRDAVLATGYDEHRAGALLEAERLFRTAAEPWCSTFF